MRSARCPPTSNWKTSVSHFVFGKHAENGSGGKGGRQFRTVVKVSVFAVTLAILYNLAINSIRTLRRRKSPTTPSNQAILGVHDIDLNVENPDFPKSSPTPNPALHCFRITGHESTRHATLDFNARTACFLRTTCLTPRTSVSGHASLFVASYVADENVTCTHVVPGYNEYKKASNPGERPACAEIWRHTRCAHGHYTQKSGDSPPSCADVRPLSEASYKAEWFPGLSIILPSYRYLHSHFHFAQAILPAIQVIVSLKKTFNLWGGRSFPRDINLILRGGLPDDFGAWQQSFLDALIYFRLKKLGFTTTVLSTYEDDWFQMEAGTFWLGEPRKGVPFCSHTSVLLGDIQDLTAWPFAGGLVADSWPFRMANGSLSYGTNGSVPVEAIVVRKVVYEYSAAKTIIPDDILDATDGSDAPSYLLLDLPPRVILYSRRNQGQDAQQEDHSRKHTPRRFSDADEKWLSDMIRSTAKASNFSVDISYPSTFDKFGDRVHKHRKAGIVIGIHGENLVDSMFAPAFSVLLEIAAHQLRNYISGGNAGLAFMSYKPVKEATVEQSSCASSTNSTDSALHCQDKRNRRIMIDDPSDRTSLSEALKHAVKYVENLHANFGYLNGIPVKLDTHSNRYVIDWSAKPNAK